MDLAAVVEKEFTQPLKDAIVAEDLIATRRLINSVVQDVEITATKQTVRVMAEKYILELRDGEQYKSPPTLEAIEKWIQAKGLQGTLDADAVLDSIEQNGTTWDRLGGSVELQAVINKANVKRVMDVAVQQEILNIKLKTKWQSR
jgi:hypothetical protein